MSDTRFTKIKFDGDTVTICQQETSENTVIERKTDCEEQPSQAFRDELQALRAHVIAICEFPPEWEQKLTVISVSMSYSKEGVMTVVITALRELVWSAAPLVLNTPAKPETPHGEGGDTGNCLSHACLAALDALTVEALCYLEGDRWAVQEELPADDEPSVMIAGPDGEVSAETLGVEFAKAAKKAKTCGDLLGVKARRK